MTAALGALALALVLTATVPAEASGKRSACSRWGDTGPAKQTRQHARRAVTCFINRARHNHGRGGLKQNERLIEAARKHSNRMANTHCFSHQCPGEPSLGTRIARTGYFRGASRWGCGENIAWQRRQRATPRKIVRGWMHSSGHRAMILSGNFRDVGVGFGRTNSGRGYYTADFGFSAG